jgi:hypothetical protein
VRDEAGQGSKRRADEKHHGAEKSAGFEFFYRRFCFSMGRIRSSVRSPRAKMTASATRLGRESQQNDGATWCGISARGAPGSRSQACFTSGFSLELVLGWRGRACRGFRNERQQKLEKQWQKRKAKSWTRQSNEGGKYGQKHQDLPPNPVRLCDGDLAASRTRQTMLERLLSSEANRMGCVPCSRRAKQFEAHWPAQSLSRLLTAMQAAVPLRRCAFGVRGDVDEAFSWGALAGPGESARQRQGNASIR